MENEMIILFISKKGVKIDNSWDCFYDNHEVLTEIKFTLKVTNQDQTLVFKTKNTKVSK